MTESELRLLDVLLEEEFGRRQPTGAATTTKSQLRVRLLVAAVLLLGTGFVLGVAWLRHADTRFVPAQEGAQDPQKPKGPDLVLDANLMPSTVAEVDAMLVKAFMLRANKVISQELVLAVFISRTEHRPDFEQWAKELRECLQHPIAKAPWERTLRLSIQVSDSKILGADFIASAPAITFDGLQQAFAPTPWLKEQLMSLAEHSRAAVTRLEDLAALPDDIDALRCPCLPEGTYLQHLRRFTSLGELELVTQGISQLPHGSIVDELLQWHLQRLRLPGRALDDGDATRFAKASHMALRIDGGLEQLTDKGIADLVRGRLEIELVDVDAKTVAAIVTAAAADNSLRRFSAFGELDEAAIEALSKLRRLRALGLGGVWLNDFELILLSRSLEAVGVTELRLEHTHVTAGPLRQLAETWHLKVLDLRRSGMSRADGDELRKLLPQCHVVLPGTPPDPASLDSIPGNTRK